MKEYILFSQLIALISCTHETNKIQLRNGDLVWRKSPFAFEGEGHHILSIKWERGACCGSQYPYLCMSLDRVDITHEKYTKPILHAYYYNGDNCNEKTRFLYKIMADDIDIIDDLGIVGHGGEIGKTYLTKLKPSKYFHALVNARGRKIIYKNGEWTYEDE